MASAIGKIISDHRPVPSNARDAKEQSKKTEEMVKELVPDIDAPPQEKRKPGRPKKSTSVSPGRKTPPVDLPQRPPETSTGKQERSAAEMARILQNGPLIEQLKHMRATFPELTGELDNYNPHLHSPEDNMLVLESIEKTVVFHIESMTAPFMIEKTITGTEEAAMRTALMYPESPISKAVLNFHGISAAMLNDKPTVYELKLWQVKHGVKLLPKEPWKRMLLNMVRLGYSVFMENVNAQEAVPNDSSNKYREL
jgi:hypothetical protein